MNREQINSCINDLVGFTPIVPTCFDNIEKFQILENILSSLKWMYYYKQYNKTKINVIMMVTIVTTSKLDSSNLIVNIIFLTIEYLENRCARVYYILCNGEYTYMNSLYIYQHIYEGNVLKMCVMKYIINYQTLYNPYNDNLLMHYYKSL